MHPTLRILSAFMLIFVMNGFIYENYGVAQNISNADVKIWENRLSDLQVRSQNLNVDASDTRLVRKEIEEIIDQAVNARNKITTRTKQIQDLVTTLKPKYEKPDSPESETVRQKRIQLEKELAAFTGRQKQTELIVIKSQQLLADLARKSRDRLTKTLFARNLSPINLRIWREAFEDVRHLTQVELIKDIELWLNRLKQNESYQNALIRTLLIALLLSAIAFVIGRKLRNRFGRVHGIESPNYSRRLLAGLVEGSGRVLAPAVFVLTVGVLATGENVSTAKTTVFLEAIVQSIITLIFGYALINAAFTPRRPQWRIVDFGTDVTSLLVFRLQLLLISFVVLNGIGLSYSWATPSNETVSVAAALYSVIITVMLYLLLDKRIWVSIKNNRQDDTLLVEQKNSRLRTLLSMALLALPILAIFGYARLSIFLINALIFSSLVIGGAALLRAMSRESIAAIFDPKYAIGRRVRTELEIDDGAGKAIIFWLRFIFDIALFVLTAIVILPAWGFGAEESMATATSVLKGVKIGSYTFSLLDISIAIGLFAIFVTLTRYVQRILDLHVLPNLSKDRGVRDALKTGVGYVGFVIAGLIGISALGLDLSNLALIAGALSVGLGFGLQNIVSNFVSGLILLAERPIKQGDWVVIGAHEGRVKNVNVRATEVETFQRASVLIPNADLISNPVINWTHKNMHGRVEIKVGVAYNTDPNLVKELLLKCALDHPNVGAYPESFVLFMDFGQSSLDFELRAYIDNVEQRVTTSSELRFAIFAALKENNIEIPFPQRVLHMAEPDK